MGWPNKGSIFLLVLVLVLVPHDRQDSGKIRYSGPVLYFMFQNVLNSQKNGFISGIRFLHSPGEREAWPRPSGSSLSLTLALQGCPGSITASNRAKSGCRTLVLTALRSRDLAPK